MIEFTRHFSLSCRPAMLTTIVLSMIFTVTNLWPVMDMCSLFKDGRARLKTYNPAIQIPEVYSLDILDNRTVQQLSNLMRNGTEPVHNATVTAPEPMVRNSTERLFFDTFLREKYPQAKPFGDFGSLEEMHQQITHVYRLGHGRSFGRTNNMLHSVLHAFDKIFDLHGNPPNNKAILAVEGWAADVLAKFFVQTSSNATKLSLDAEWKRKLESIPPHALVHTDRLDALNLTEQSGKIVSSISAQEAYFYTLQNYATLSAPVQEHRRRIVWGNLLKHTLSDNLVGYSLLQKYLMEHFQTTKYVAIHARWLEGGCPGNVGSELSQDECYMEPSYINDLVHFANHTDLPIVFISDGQREEIPINLRNDPTIGPKFVHVEQILKVPPSTEVQNDMMIAIFSDLFIGTRMSTMATSIAMSRAILRAEPESNLVWIRPIQKDNPSGTNLRGGNGERLDTNSSDGTGYRNWHICKQCAFACNPDTSSICGKRRVGS